MILNLYIFDSRKLSYTKDKDERKYSQFFRKLAET